ncbi:hypothetical protein AB0V79_24355 [Mesorhizobium ciceri]|uniref:hypothetical protein n=1 Tax=Mesorhizobium TaxID=68287 RepID=UPI0007A9469C|nr:hypothetical protein [Mesorhizobium ciceri]AMX98786.1 hypothetical protein A4R29_04090 [Mesorhizobium ciceri biovar biserrulae]
MIYIDRSKVKEPNLDGVDKHGKTELERARDHFANGANGSFEFTAYGKPDVRDAVNALTGHKCAYCESSYAATAPVAVEHYRPKGRIVVRKAPRTEMTGYWWLAAAWENLLPSCTDCNSARWQQIAESGEEVLSGKADYFPLLDEAKRATAEGKECDESPVLLNPCDPACPDLLAFEVRRGESLVVSRERDKNSDAFRRADGTIKIVGLNRSLLVKLRTERMMLAMAWARLARKKLQELQNLPAGVHRDSVQGDIEEALVCLKPYVQRSAPWSAAIRAAVRSELEPIGLKI